MSAGDVADRISHGQNGQSEGQADPKKSDPQRREVGGEDCAPATGECQPKGAKEFGPKTSRHLHVSALFLFLRAEQTA
jgi:hypothetical protein